MNFSVFPGVILLVFLIALISRNFRGYAANWFSRNPGRFLLLPPVAIALYAIPSLLSHSFQEEVFWKITVYCAAPMPFILISAISKKRSFLLDVSVILLLWLPVELKWFSWPFIIWYDVCAILILLNAWRQTEINCLWSLKMDDIKIVCAVFLVLSAVIIPPAWSVGFLKFGINQSLFSEPQRLLLKFAFIFFAIAIPEEVLFRGFIQNVIKEKVKFFPALFTASIIFGLAHLNNPVATSVSRFGVPNYWYALFGMIAGIGYGYVYEKRRSLLSSVLLHTFVDFTWMTFFCG